MVLLVVDQRAGTRAQARSVGRNHGTEDKSQLQHLLALMWNSPAGFCNHLVHFIICLNIIFVTSRGLRGQRISSPLWCKMLPRLRSKQFMSPTTALENVRTVHSFTAGSPLTCLTLESGVSSDTEGCKNAFSPEQLLLGHQEEITQHHAVHYCL